MTPDRQSMASRSFGRAIEAKHELTESVAVYVARGDRAHAPAALGNH